MRDLPFITMKKILIELTQEVIGNITYDNKGKEILIISRPTFLRKEKELGFPFGRLNQDGWRIYSREESEQIKKILKEKYRWVNFNQKDIVKT